jgi:hypothetical protein
VVWWKQGFWGQSSLAPLALSLDHVADDESKTESLGEDLVQAFENHGLRETGPVRGAAAFS